MFSVEQGVVGARIRPDSKQCPKLKALDVFE